MKEEWIKIINQHLGGIQPTVINSSLVSAQNRERLYWIGKRE
nr:MAG TPA: DNA methyltransferase [Caudoviricetes sp.]